MFGCVWSVCSLQAFDDAADVLLLAGVLEVGSGAPVDL